MHFKRLFHMVAALAFFFAMPRVHAQTGKKINGDSLQIASDIKEMETIIRDLAARISLFEADNKSKANIMVLIREKRRAIDSQMTILRTDSMTMEKMNKKDKNVLSRLEKTKNSLTENEAKLKQVDKDFALIQSNKMESDTLLVHSRQLLLELSAKLIEYRKLASQ